MTKLPAIYVWDNDYFLRRSTLIRRTMLVLIGAGIGLLLIDLSKPWLLAPLAIAFFFLIRLQKSYEVMIAQCSDASVSFSPNSFLLHTPNLSTEERIPYHAILTIEPAKKLGYTGFVITLAADKKAEDQSTRQLELIGYCKTQELKQRLQQYTQMNEQTASTV